MVWRKKKGIAALDIRRTPMTDKTNDPVAIWQKMMGEMEKGFNSFANQAMSSPEFSQAMNRAGGVAAGAQKQLGELMEKYLVSMNLPSRDQVTGLAERLQSIEAQIGEMKSMLSQIAASSGISQGFDGAPKPPRTKRPPSENGGQT
ncbi:hypothetical protein BJS_06251 [Bradyrhizobium japonicum SEMIA 5079]|nr:hypothetical protein BJS_06251 [Bradyrhizobium japonicum SEMIA 5079]